MSQPEIEFDASLVPMTDADVEATLARNAKHQAQLLAEARLPVAFKVLDEVMGDVEGPAGARVSAAKTVIEQASGRPGMQKQRAGDGAGLTINILELNPNGGAVKRGLEVAGRLLGNDFVKQLDAEAPFAVED